MSKDHLNVHIDLMEELQKRVLRHQSFSDHAGSGKVSIHLLVTLTCPKSEAITRNRWNMIHKINKETVSVDACQIPLSAMMKV